MLGLNIFDTMTTYSWSWSDKSRCVRISHVITVGVVEDNVGSWSLSESLESTQDMFVLLMSTCSSRLYNNHDGIIIIVGDVEDVRGSWF